MGDMELLPLPLGSVCFLVLLCPLSAEEVHSILVDEGGEDVRRSDFPDDFLFGTATSSYQVEGAFNEDGKGLSNWDVFCHVPGNIENDDNGDVADNHYHRFMEDVELMHSLGVNAYRFSISWSRILPRGRFGEVNPKGVSFYSKLIDSLLLRGIEPFVTLHHHDFPQELEDRYGAWLSPSIQEDFVLFANTCFDSFGDRVKYWATVNEPILFLDMAYVRGLYPPKHCSQPFGNCTAGNSDTEPLVAMHNLILSHAKAVRAYRNRYQREKGGSIGIIISTTMYEPLRDMDIDREAAQRALAFDVAWALDPLVHGRYPPEMRKHVGGELPEFTQEEEEYAKGSVDFVGVNHYTTLYAKDCIHSACEKGGGRPISGFVNTTGLRDSIPIGDPTGMPKMFVVPRGMEEMVNYVRDRYKNVPMYITENGYPSLLPERNGQPNNPLHDIKRVSYHKAYLASLLKAIRDGADVREYFIWSLMDNFEWLDGYSVRFGLYHVDRGSLERRPKLSARWYRYFLAASTTAPKVRIPGNDHGSNSGPM